MKPTIVAAVIISTLMISGGIVGTVFLLNDCTDCIVEQPTDNENESSSVWDEITFRLINESYKVIGDFIGRKLLVEFASSNCPDCNEQNNVLNQINNLLIQEDNDIVILTLMIDLETSKELLTYYINNNISWLIGSINEANHTKIGLEWVPAFYLFNTSGELIKTKQSEMNYEELMNFLSMDLNSKN